MTVDPRTGITLRAQLAALLREKIRSGDLAPGSVTPSGPALADEYRVSRYTADRALDLLAAEGLVQRISGVGTVVVDAGPPRKVVTAPAGARISARMPAAGERAAIGLPAGVPVLVIDPGGGREAGVYGADRTVIAVPAPRLGR